MVDSLELSNQSTYLYSSRFKFKSVFKFKFVPSPRRPYVSSLLDRRSQAGERGTKRLYHPEPDPEIYTVLFPPF